MDSGPYTLLRIILVATSISFILAAAALPAWFSDAFLQTRTAYHSLLAFLSIVCASTMLARSREGSAEWKTLFYTPFLYSAIYNLATAVHIFLTADGPTPSTDIMLAVHIGFSAIFSVQILVITLLRYRDLTIRHEAGTSATLLSSGLLGSIALDYFIFLLPSDSLGLLSGGLGLAAGLSLCLAGVIYFRIRYSRTLFETSFHMAGFSLFGFALIPCYLSIVVPSYLWTVAFPMQSAGLLVLSLSASIPYLTEVGWKTKSAVQFTLGFSVVGFFPVLMAIIVGGFLPRFYYQTYDGFVLIHAGAAVLSFGLAFLVLSYDQSRFSMGRHAVAFLFMTWSVIEIFYVLQVLLSPLIMTGERTLVPYAVGSLLTLTMLVLAVRWLKRPHPEHPRLFRWMPVSALPITVLLTTAGVLVESVLKVLVPGYDVSRLVKAVVLTATVLVVFSYVYLESRLASTTKGRVSIDLLATRFLALWIIPQILKANYDEWSFGWWLAEVTLFSALLVGIVVFGHFYIKEINRAERSQRKATLYADLLMHDISNYHQALSLCLGLLEVENMPPEQKKRTLRDANADLARADQLVRNVRRMGMIEEIDRRSFHPVDIVATVEDAFEVASRSPAAEGFFLMVTRKRGECFVMANALLLDVFLNLFTNSIQYSSEEKSISVDVTDVKWNGVDAWQISITDRGKGIEPEVKARLFQRYMEGARRTGLGLSVAKALVDVFSGSIDVRDRVAGDYTKGTVFVITMPASSANE